MDHDLGAKNGGVDEIEHSVWDEPALAQSFAGTPVNKSETYGGWLGDRIAETTELQSWGLTIGVALLSGPWALITWLFAGGFSWNSVDFFFACLILPMTQEIGKVAFPLWVVEKRPYWFQGWFQIFVCSLASATTFVVAINLFLIITSLETQGQLIFQFTVYLTMHLLAAFFAAIGLEKIWRTAMVNQQRPRLEHGYRWFMIALLINISYSTVFWFYQRGTEWIESMPKPETW